MLLKLVFAAAAITAVWAYVPIGGRSMADRWRQAKTPAEFFDRTWTDIRGEPESPPRVAQPARTRRAPAERPTESHRESDRRELGRILADRLRE